MKRPNYSAFTLTEAIVCVAVFGVLLTLALANTTVRMPPMTYILSNAKQLHLATQQMALDGTTTGNTNLSWPGDTGGTFTNWARRLVPGYLSTNDFCKLMSAGRLVARSGNFPHFSKTSILAYAVGEDGPGDAVFLSSANFTNTPTGGLPLDPKALPYGNRGFIIFHKAGDGAILMPKQVGNTNVIGGFAPLCQ